VNFVGPSRASSPEHLAKQSGHYIQTINTVRVNSVPASGSFCLNSAQSQGAVKDRRWEDMRNYEMGAE